MYDSRIPKNYIKLPQNLAAINEMVRNEGMRRAEVAEARARVPKRLLVDEEGEEEVAGGKVDNKSPLECHLHPYILGGGARRW